MISAFLFPLINSMKTSSKLISLHIAGDNFVHDIRAAQKNKFFFLKKISSEKIVLNSNDSTIKWHIKNNKLERITKLSDEVKAITSVVCSRIVGKFIIDYAQGK